MLKIVGLLFVLLGFALSGLEIYWWGQGDPEAPFELRSLGEWWFRLDKDSLQLAQAGIERHVSPWLWENIAQPLLLWPAAVQAMVLGIALLVVFRVLRWGRG